MKYSLKISKQVQEENAHRSGRAGKLCLLDFILQWVNGQREERPRLAGSFSSAFYDNQYYIALIMTPRTGQYGYSHFTKETDETREATCQGHATGK